MLDFEEFQNENKVTDNKEFKSKIKFGRLKKKKLLVKLNQFYKQKKEILNNPTHDTDVGGINYYDRY